MTELLTRLRQMSRHSARVRLSHRISASTSEARTVFAEAQERLATGSEIEALQAWHRSSGC